MQIPIRIPHNKSYKKSDYIVSSNNEFIWQYINNPSSWQNIGLWIIGEASSGKTHLAHIFSEQNNAFFVKNLNTDLADFIEQSKDADYFIFDGVMPKTSKQEENMFHYFNLAKENKAKILMLNRCRLDVTEFIELKDLQSRLTQLSRVEIKKPDDNMINLLLMKLLSDRQIVLPIKYVNYISLRIKPSYCAIYNFVQDLDNISLSAKKKISFSLIKELL